MKAKDLIKILEEEPEADLAIGDERDSDYGNIFDFHVILRTKPNLFNTQNTKFWKFEF